MHGKRLTLVIITALLAGCESRQMNLKPPTVVNIVDVNRPRSDEEIRAIRQHTPPITPYGRLGIIFMPPLQADSKDSRQTYLFNDTEQQAWVTAFKDDYIFEDVVFVSTTFSPAPSRDIRSLRWTAARHGCDYVLVYAMSHDHSRQSSPLSILYLTIIGAYTVPGEIITVGTMARGVLLDVETDYVYGWSDGSAYQSTAVPVGWVAATLPRLYQASARQATQNLRENFAPLVDRMRAEVARATYNE